MHSDYDPIRSSVCINAGLNSDAEAAKQEREDFDFVDQSAIKPIVKLAQQYQNDEDARRSIKVGDAKTARVEMTPKATVGLWLNLDVQREEFVGELADEVHALLRRCRKTFVVPKTA